MTLIEKIQATSALLFMDCLIFCMIGPKNTDELWPGVLIAWGIIFNGFGVIFIVVTLIGIWL